MIDKKEYPIYLTKEQLEAIPIILNMALVFSWDLYSKSKDDKYYEIHQQIIKDIKEYHNKGYQGILAVGSFIEAKSNIVLKNLKLSNILKPYMKKYNNGFTRIERGSFMSKPLIELITCESGDWEVLRVNLGEDFQEEGHSINHWQWIDLIKLLGYEVEKREISDEDMEYQNY